MAVLFSAIMNILLKSLIQQYFRVHRVALLCMLLQVRQFASAKLLSLNLLIIKRELLKTQRLLQTDL